MQHKDRFTEAFINLVGSQNYYEFMKRVTSNARSIFFSNNCRLVYVHNDSLLVYSSKNGGDIYNVNTGLSGICATQKKQMLVTDISLTEIYNQKVDIYTLLPVLGYPIIDEDDPHEVVHAVFQISMRERNQYRLAEKVTYLEDKPINTETLQYSVELYTKLVLQAYLITKERLGQHDTEGFRNHILNS